MHSLRFGSYLFLVLFNAYFFQLKLNKLAGIINFDAVKSCAWPAWAKPIRATTHLLHFSAGVCLQILAKIETALLHDNSLFTKRTWTTDRESEECLT